MERRGERQFLRGGEVEKEGIEGDVASGHQIMMRRAFNGMVLTK